MLLRSTEKYFLQFLDFNIFLSTNFAENMNSALPSIRLLPHFEKIYIESSTANATFFDLIFSLCNRMKTFVCNYHLNDPTTFLHHQIQVCSAHACILALGYKTLFTVLRVHGLVIFQHRAQIQNL